MFVWSIHSPLSSSLSSSSLTFVNPFLPPLHGGGWPSSSSRLGLTPCAVPSDGSGRGWLGGLGSEISGCITPDPGRILESTSSCRFASRFAWRLCASVRMAEPGLEPPRGELMLGGGSDAKCSSADFPITPVRGTAPARAAPAGPASPACSRADAPPKLPAIPIPPPPHPAFASASVMDAHAMPS